MHFQCNVFNRCTLSHGHMIRASFQTKGIEMHGFCGNVCLRNKTSVTLFPLMVDVGKHVNTSCVPGKVV